MKILLAGGGSGGPVSPVLAVAQQIRKLKPRAEFLFVGTRQGPERAMVEAEQIRFVTVPAARLRRFFTLKNLAAPVVFVAGLLAAWRIISQFRLELMFSAGGFVAVPVAWIARMFGAKIVIHQQDAKVGLANRLISPIASQITTAFEATSQQFYSGSGLIGKLKAAVWVGNPVREELFVPPGAVQLPFKLHADLPILLVLTGATGAAQINFLVSQILPALVKNFQIVHQTGRGKNETKFEDVNYHPVEFLPFDQYVYLLKKCQLVVCRAGLSTIAELSALGKVAVVIPMPFTHQDNNAAILKSTRSAIVLGHDQAKPAILLKVITALNFDPQALNELSVNISKLMPHDSAAVLAHIVLNQ
ncbi:MAG: hypothetical protein A3H14_01740 [Candidatus Doudnabacteria bacterium RIFCSPLOWO2_12_FULL_49_8]|nr:MAG: hypothetical protein A3H14_01740 [Candidatus Doudnabacteria bacterium RIFCSPLOWO2_12_FULL_49_8]